MYVTINLFLLPVKEKAASIAHFQMFKNVLYLFNLSKALLAGKFIGIVGKKFDLFILYVYSVVIFPYIFLAFFVIRVPGWSIS